MDLAYITQQFQKGMKFSQERFDLSPPYRGKYDLDEVQKNAPKIGGVMLLFYAENDKTKIVLTERKKYPGVHSGQMSFPGGKKDEQDVSITATALRETHEEVGISAEKIEIIGSLTELYIPPSNFLVYPTVGILHDSPNFVKQEAEVETIVPVALEHILHEKSKQQTTIIVNQNQLTVPAYIYQNYVIWGATAIMLREMEYVLTHK